MTTNVQPSHNDIDDLDEWKVFGRRVPKQEAVFFSQIILIYAVVITCILNLSLTRENSNLWTALLSSCLGYILPSPSIKTAPQRFKEISHRPGEHRTTPIISRYNSADASTSTTTTTP